MVASKILNFTLRIGSSHNGPSRQPHWNPCTIEFLTSNNSCLSTSDGNVSSSNKFGPCASGPNAQMDLCDQIKSTQPKDDHHTSSTKLSISFILCSCSCVG